MPTTTCPTAAYDVPAGMFAKLASQAEFGQEVVNYILRLTSALHHAQAQCDRLRSDLRNVKERLMLELGRRFAAKRESFIRQSIDSGQILLGFFADLSEQKQADDLGASPLPSGESSADDHPPDEKNKNKKNQRERKPLDLSKLERHVVASSKLTDKQRQCSTCGHECRCIKTIERERIGFKPAHFYIEVCEREVGVCDHCETPPVTAENPQPHLDESKIAPSLQAGILVAKLGFGIPWNRWSRMMEDASGMTLPETSLERLTQRSLTMLIPLAGCAKAQSLKSSTLSIDDSFGKILLPQLERVNALGQPDIHGKTTQAGRFWFALGDVSKVAFVQYTPNWKASNLESLLDSTRAQLQGDGYAGYVSYCQSHGLKTPAGCMDHARRLFVQAHKLGYSQAADVLERMASLYEIEAHIRCEDIVDFALILERRTRLSEPIFDKLAELISHLHQSRMARDALSRATTYFLGQESRLRVYLSDGRIPISNVHVERMIRVYAVMRAACKLIGSPKAAVRMAAGLTIVINAILAQVSLHEYFTWLFSELPKHDGGDLSEYLPQAYARRKASAS